MMIIIIILIIKYKIYGYRYRNIWFIYYSISIGGSIVIKSTTKLCCN